MAQAEAIRSKEFRERFATEDACKAELFRLRFAEGLVCPKCGNWEFYLFKCWNTFQRRYCRLQTSVIAGMAMRPHLPLTVRFRAIWLVATDKRGISVVRLANTLGICYDSAWHLLDCIRAIMGKRDVQYLLNRIVKMDNGYVGGSAMAAKGAEEQKKHKW